MKAANRTRKFLSASSKLRKGFTLPGENPGFSLHFTFNTGCRLESSFEETDALVRYAALLRPFMDTSSNIELHTFCQFLRDSRIIDAPTEERIATALEMADERLSANLVLNGRALSARDIYFAYAEGHLFADERDATQLLASLGTGPLRHLTQFQFYSTCVQYAEVVFMIAGALLAAAKSRPWITGEPTAGRCIYCLAETTGAEPVEHVIPEAFGLDELVLQGSVCGACNNELSRLDQALADSDVLSLLRVINVQLTKKGKFPRADFCEFELLKTGPRRLEYRIKAGRNIFQTVDLGNGQVQFNIKATGKRPFDPALLARSLFKVGLGLVAYDAGLDAACHSRYDAARAFIRGTATFPNNLIMSTKAKPNARVTTAWNEIADATRVVLTFYGIVFAFNLQPTPFGLTDEAQDLPLTSHWLGG